MSQSRRVSIVLALNAAMIAGLVVAGLLAHSLSLLSEGGDFLTDSLALALGLLAVYLRDHHRNERATTWVALINGLWLLILSAGVITAAGRRLVTGSPEVHSWPVLVVSAIAAAVMLVAALVIGGDAGEEDLHMRSIAPRHDRRRCSRGSGGRGRTGDHESPTVGTGSTPSRPVSSRP